MTHKHDISEMPETKRKLVDAAIKLMRIKGFNATSVDDICEGAGVTKGAFFHYFKSKDELAKATVLRFSEEKSLDILDAPFRKLADPLERVYGRLDFVKASAGGRDRLTKGCLIGILAQELSFTHPELRGACQAAFLRIAREFEKDLAEAKSLYAPHADFDPKGLAMLYISIFQGSSLMAKAAENNSVMMDNIEQFRRYLQILLGKVSSSQKNLARVAEAVA
jgi:TetR/AcrR family transcriptional repressor of nem operon